MRSMRDGLRRRARREVLARDGRTHARDINIVEPKESAKEEKLKGDILQGHRNGRNGPSRAASVTEACVLVRDDHICGRDAREYVTHSGKVKRRAVSACSSAVAPINDSIERG